MKALVCTAQGTPVAEQIQFQDDFPPPQPPGPGEVTVATMCSAFNHMDLWVGRGVPGLSLTYPRVSGCDACGDVVAVGPGVADDIIGRRVILNAAIPLQSIGRPDDPPESTLAPDFELIGEHHSPGTHAQRFNAPVSNLADVGDADPVQAAAFGLCALTAWSMMVSKAGLRHGSTVLIPGIGGGVATSALGIARHFGCTTIVTSRHEWKLEEARKIGADVTILDQGQDWSRDVRTATRKRGVDMAVDSVGKATHLWCIKSLARGGAYVTPGCTTGPDATTDLARVFWNQLRMFGSTMGSNSEFKEVVSLFRSGALAPAVDRVLPPEQGQDAYRRLEAGEQFGKIVIDWR